MFHVVRVGGRDRFPGVAARVAPLDHPSFPGEEVIGYVDWEREVRVAVTAGRDGPGHIRPFELEGPSSRGLPPRPRS